MGEVIFWFCIAGGLALIGIFQSSNQNSNSSISYPSNTVKPPVVTCPRCNSQSISANKQGFGMGKAAVGAVALGPVGLIAGKIGSNKMKNYCMNCGHEWKP